ARGRLRARLRQRGPALARAHPALGDAPAPPRRGVGRPLDARRPDHPGRGTGGLGLRAPGARVRRRRDGRCGRRRGHPACGGGRGRADPGTGRDERARRRPGGGRAGRRAMTATLEKPPTASGPEPGGGRAARSLSTPWQVLIVLVVWVLGWAIFRGTDTLELGGAELTGFQTWLNELRDAFDSARQGSFFFEYIIDPISTVLDAVINWLRELLSQPACPRPVPG